ncbi:serine/threonine-protein kinase [Kitasatospora sp. NPDC088346]|uniref:serine/threonine-protein kinase n=1 Tax=Kitasatospora sp. NPDC088346 TaxID=3364073 RepID=UPI0038124316
MEALVAGDPQQIGDYRLLRRLGAGGMGRVYLGRTAGGRTVAVKVVHGEYAADPEFRSRFRQEVEAARRVGGRWTAPVLDADTEGAHPWVATGYVAGPALGAAVREFGPLPAGAVRTLGAGLADALAAVHALGLVHRDVKPSNVLLALDGPQLIDFGIARALDAATVLTRSGFVVGSPGFMSPEQAQGRTPGPAGDVFSLGAVLAYAATGTAPFGEGLSAAALIYRVVHEPPELGALDGDLRELVAACLAKDPADRPTPEQVRDRLTAATGDTVRLGQAGWLPPAVSESVARLAVELLGLDAEATREPAGRPAEAEPATELNGPPTELDGPATELDGPAGGRASGGTVAGPGPAGGTGRLAGAGRRRAVAVGGVVLALVLTAGLTFWLSHGPGTPGASGGAQPSESASNEAGDSAQAGDSAEASDGSGGGAAGQDNASAEGSAEPAGAVPEGYLGTWQGEVTQESGAVSTYRIQLVQGQVGDTVGHAATTGAAPGVQCGETSVLVSASEQSVVVSETLTTTNPGCTPEVSAPLTFELGPDGTLELKQDGFANSRLTRQS